MLGDAKDITNELEGKYGSSIGYPSADDAGGEEDRPLCYAKPIIQRGCSGRGGKFIKN